MSMFKGKVAIITGAASGIGLAYAKELLRNELKGVAIIDIDEENGQCAVKTLSSEFGAERVIYLKADVSSQEQLRAAFDATVEKYKQLDIVINNAGIVNEALWEKVVQINFVGVIIGTFLATKEYFPKYKSSDETMIVNVASITAFLPFSEIPVYVATKSGVVGFSRSMGSELNYQQTKTKVITICPNCVNTPLLDKCRKRTTREFHNVQKSEDLAQSTIEVMKTATSGSVWAISVNGCTEIEFPSCPTTV